MSKVPYLKVIGSLMYLMLGMRPDLAYTINSAVSAATPEGSTGLELNEPSAI